jgi:nitrate reductase gamma subunit
MQRIKPFLFLIAAGLLLAITDPSLAGNKFTTIGGGVSGQSKDKIALMKNLSIYIGGFLVLVGIAGLATKKRFEGMVLMASGKGVDKAVIISIIIMLVGFGLIGIYFFA